MTQGFQQFTKAYAKVLGVLMGLTVLSSILLYSGCGMTNSPNMPTTPTPTPPPTPTPTPDTTPPTSTITSPTEGTIVLIGTQVAITGTASDAGGGSVARVEVSVDGGAIFSVATGTNAWSFNWTPSSPGQVTIKSRAVDNTGNVQNPQTEIQVTVRVPNTIRVPTEQPTIQSAIDFASDGATVLVAPGTYPENINFKGKAITVRSESGPGVTIIDGGNADSVAIFNSGEGRDSVLNGFKLQNGRPPSSRSSDGGGILIQSSSPTITNNVITNNQACRGSGIWINLGSPVIQLNTITGNINDVCTFAGGGGGIFILGAGFVEILDNVISDNVNLAGGGIGIFGAGTTPIIKRNVIKGNRATVPGQGDGSGGGIFMTNVVNALIIQNLITGNQALTGGGVSSSGGSSVLVNNTIVDNHVTAFGSGLDARGHNLLLTNNIIVANPGQSALHCSLNGPTIIRFNNIFSPHGPAYGGTCYDRTGADGNISADPEFIAPPQGDYHLQLWSPSIDAGDNQAPNLPDKDLDGDLRILDGDDNGTGTIDMGVDEFRLLPGSTTPISTIKSPREGATVATGTVSITGLARDAGGGTVARVEVSVDGGATWNLATGTTAWSFDWMPATPGPATIRSRAVDDSGNIQDPPAQIAVTVRVPVIIRVPSHHPTIQAAIDVAEVGDRVLVAPGTYGGINFGGKAITITSESGPDVTFIDGGDANPVVVFTSGEGRDSVLNGFTLQNGRAGIGDQGAIDGGGVKVQGSSPTITNNLITNNHACHGGGIGIRFGSPLIQRNTITNNKSNLCSGGGGSGISIQGVSSAEILDNVISNNGMDSFGTNNSGGGIYLDEAGTPIINPIIKRNIIKGNSVADGQGGGIWMGNNSNALIVQNLITGNQAREGGGIYWIDADASGPRLVNNTIADNDGSPNGFSIFAQGIRARMELTNNIIVAKPGQFALFCSNINEPNQVITRFNNIFSAGGMAYGGSCSNRTGTDGNISADPLFTNPTQGDFHLQQGSPSIDAGDNQAPNLPDTDLDGNSRTQDGNGDGNTTIDMGVYELPAPTLISGFRMRARGIAQDQFEKRPVSVYSMRWNRPNRKLPEGSSGLNLRLFAEPQAPSWTRTRATIADSLGVDEPRKYQNHDDLRAGLPG